MKKFTMFLMAAFLMISNTQIFANELRDGDARIQEILTDDSEFAGDKSEITIDEAVMNLKGASAESGFAEFLATFSTDPADLDPIRGTTWAFTYTISTTIFTDTIRFGTTTQYASDGTVALTSRNQYGATGYVFFIYDTQIGPAFGSVVEGSLLIEFHTFQVNGTTANGYYGFKEISTGYYSSIYSMSGVRVSGPTTTTTTSTPVVTTTTSIDVVTTTTSTPVVTTTIVPATYSISGTVSGDLRANISIKLTGTASKNTTTDQNGYYTFSDLAGGYYTITPNNENYDFDPPNYVIQNLTSNLTSMDFIATKYNPMPCAAEAIYGEDSEEIELLRFVRDNFLSKTPEGRELIKVYYQWSPSILKAIQNDEEFKEEIKKMINKYVH